jgi:hypothetical protein
MQAKDIDGPQMSVGKAVLYTVKRQQLEEIFSLYTQLLLLVNLLQTGNVLCFDSISFFIQRSSLFIREFYILCCFFLQSYHLAISDQPESDTIL